jgi:hypothetical protein
MAIVRVNNRYFFSSNLYYLSDRIAHEHEHDHEHKIHHEHDAKVTIDFHNIVDIIKQQLHESEQRLLSAIHHEHQHATSSPAAVVLKSYRIADREK